MQRELFLSGVRRYCLSFLGFFLLKQNDWKISDRITYNNCDTKNLILLTKEWKTLGLVAGLRIRRLHPFPEVYFHTQV